MKLIDKSALIAEIERIRKNQRLDDRHGQGVLDGLHAIKKFIDTLEVKEVDLESNVDRILEEHDWSYNKIDFYKFAKHFFELGLKVQKNIWHTMDETPNYPCDILFLTDVDNMFLYRYMENGRPVDIKTPYFHNILNGKCWCYCDDIKAQNYE